MIRSLRVSVTRPPCLCQGDQGRTRRLIQVILVKKNTPGRNPLPFRPTSDFFRMAPGFFQPLHGADNKEEPIDNRMEQHEPPVDHRVDERISRCRKSVGQRIASTPGKHGRISIWISLESSQVALIDKDPLHTAPIVTVLAFAGPRKAIDKVADRIMATQSISCDRIRDKFLGTGRAISGNRAKDASQQQSQPQPCLFLEPPSH